MDIPLSALVSILVLLIVLSAFFSGSETALMTLNRYRLRHLAKAKHPGATRAAELLKRPDRLIGVILLCNNFVNNLATSITSLIAIELLSRYVSPQTAVAIGAFVITIIFLIFSEVAPKTLGALHPERVAFPAAFVYQYLLRLLNPLVLVINWMANGVLRIFRLHSPNHTGPLALSAEELRTVVHEAGALIPRRHQRMLLSVLDLETVTVDDIMVPRPDISGIDIESDWKEIEDTLINSPYTKLPLYREGLDNVLGFIHLRNVVQIIRKQDFTKDDLIAVATETYYIPEGTSLNTQLLNFQRRRQRLGLVVNEYGDVLGLVTMEDILEEIVGEFTTDPAALSKDIIPQDDGSFLIDGSAHIRTINRRLKLDLPTDGPKTINGLILELMETIPDSDVSLLINGYPVEIIQVKDNSIKTVKIMPQLRQLPKKNKEPLP